MKKAELIIAAAKQTLEAGQVWNMPDANLEVGMVGKLLVHYKLGKPNAVRVSNSCASIKIIEKFLKTNKAVLQKTNGKKVAT